MTRALVSASLALALVAPGCAPAERCPSVTPDACDAPADVRVTDVVDLDTFRAAASVLVCDWALRCDDTLASFFCHPEFAALEARRLPEPMQAPFELEIARACVDRLLVAPDCGEASLAYWDCHRANAGGWAEVAEIEGAPCSAACSFGLVCALGRCVAPVELGDACDEAHPCVIGLACRDRVCTAAAVGERCDVSTCGEGLVCASHGWGDPSGARCELRTTCDPVRAMHHVGCACDADADCAYDVAVCRDGACVLRPFPGEPCSESGPACFGSSCAAGVCALAPRGGSCVWHTDCASHACSVDHGGWLGAAPGVCL